MSILYLENVSLRTDSKSILKAQTSLGSDTAYVRSLIPNIHIAIILNLAFYSNRVILNSKFLESCYPFYQGHINYLQKNCFQLDVNIYHNNCFKNLH